MPDDFDFLRFMPVVSAGLALVIQYLAIHPGKLADALRSRKLTVGTSARKNVKIGALEDYKDDDGVQKNKRFLHAHYADLFILKSVSYYILPLIALVSIAGAILNFIILPLVVFAVAFVLISIFLKNGIDSALKISD